MRVSVPALLAGAVLLAQAPLAAQQLREDSFKWYVGAQGGVLVFESQTQDRTGIGTAGVHTLIMAKRAALQLSVEEAFGSNEPSAFGDALAPNGTRPVTFDRLRKYSAMLMAFPLRAAKVEPFFGVGFGIMHTVDTQVEGIVTSPDEASEAVREAKDRGSSGFGSLLGGLQARLSPLFVIFGQYQVTTSPSSGSLLVGPTHTVAGGFRFAIGGAKEGIRGGGY